jgi:acyl dehydratase
MSNVGGNDGDKGVLLGKGWYHDEMPMGFRFRTKWRTLTEADLNAFINLTWFTEDLFVNTQASHERSLGGRVVPAMLLYCFAEGLISPSMEFTGQAFLASAIDVKAPTVLGDTIHVECEVVESRPASRGNRGLVRTRNEIVNQRGETVLVYRPLRLVAGSPSR